MPPRRLPAARAAVPAARRPARNRPAAPAASQAGAREPAAAACAGRGPGLCRARLKEPARRPHPGSLGSRVAPPGERRPGATRTPGLRQPRDGLGPARAACRGQGLPQRPPSSTGGLPAPTVLLLRRRGRATRRAGTRRPASLPPAPVGGWHERGAKSCRPLPHAFCKNVSVSLRHFSSSPGRFKGRTEIQPKNYWEGYKKARLPSRSPPLCQLQDRSRRADAKPALSEQDPSETQPKLVKHNNSMKNQHQHQLSQPAGWGSKGHPPDTCLTNGVGLLGPSGPRGPHKHPPSGTAQSPLITGRGKLQSNIQERSDALPAPVQPPCPGHVSLSSCSIPSQHFGARSQNPAHRNR